MRVLISGIEGFTGRHLRVQFAELGWEVFGFGGRPAQEVLARWAREDATLGGERNDAPRALYRQVDLLDTEQLRSVAQWSRPGAVVHLAGISAVTHADQQAFYSINLFGSLNLLEALTALPQPPEKILLASSANIYGNAKASLIAETIHPQPVNHYAMSKLAMEFMALNYAERLPLVIVRPFNYTGVGHDNRFVIPKIVEHFKSQAPRIELGNLDVYREYNDVRMVCVAYLQLLKNGVNGEIYNVCSGRTHSLREVIATAEKISGHQIDVKINPAFVRTNEVGTLAGNPEKLKSAVGNLPTFSLQDTLSWMLDCN